MMTDPIADLLTRIRNAIRSRKATCTMPGSTLKVRVLDVLKREGYVDSYEVMSDGPKSVILVNLRYTDEGAAVIHGLRRFSKPGCRRYRSVEDLPEVRGGLGISVISTNRGVLSDRECRQQKVGGEVLCTVE